MVNIERKQGDMGKLVKSEDLLSLAELPVRPAPKRMTNRAEPYIRGHRVKGKTYYYFVEGDREVYLGTARAILKAVKGDTYQ